MLDFKGELLSRYAARKGLAAYIRYCAPDFIESDFSNQVTSAIDVFIERTLAGERPIVLFQAAPQTGKSTIVSRHLPAYLVSKYPNLRVGACSYSDDLAQYLAQDVRRNLQSDAHRALFPVEHHTKLARNRVGGLDSPGGVGYYLSAGVGSGLTGKSLDVAIIDDVIKNAKEAESPTVKEGHWNWYNSVFKTRLSKNSGQIIMATSWCEDDLPGRILKAHAGDSRFTHLKFPAIDANGQSQVPGLHPLEQFLEIKQEIGLRWWNALYMQEPLSDEGAVFKSAWFRYWDKLPVKFDKVVCSWDCAFKGEQSSDYVVGQLWAKKGAETFLIDQVRGRLSFTETVHAMIELRNRFAACSEILVEDTANGPAIIDLLKRQIPGIVAVRPDGSKLARAHAITAFFESGSVFFPKHLPELITELCVFPNGANDDQVDALTQALRRLYFSGAALKISPNLMRIVGI